MGKNWDEERGEKVVEEKGMKLRRHIKNSRREKEREREWKKKKWHQSWVRKMEKKIKQWWQR